VVRFFIGLLFGVVLTAQALLFAGVGHGSYAPMVCVASVLALMPILGLLAGPLLWALYFLVIPNLVSRTRTITLSLILALHLVPAFLIAYQDPAFARASLLSLAVFGFTFLATVGLLLFLAYPRDKRKT
jgi:hypothetical protein